MDSRRAAIVGSRRPWPRLFVLNLMPVSGDAVINNDVLRSIRYALDLGDSQVIGIIQLADPAFVIDKSDVRAFIAREDDVDFKPCSDAVLARFLDGLVIYLRGRDDSLPMRPIEKRVTNNLVLKKLRVAFQLKDVDMHAIFESAGFALSRPEMTALFRQAGHKHYRACGDQILRNFMKGLTLAIRKSD